jgi:hypothetical protein
MDPRGLLLDEEHSELQNVFDWFKEMVSVDLSAYHWKILAPLLWTSMLK